MNLEPNRLLAGATIFALVLLVTSASMFGPARAMVYIGVAMICVLAFVRVNGAMMKSRGRRGRGLIGRDRPAVAVFAGFFVLVILTSAFLPAIAPRGDYTLMIAMAAVWTGVTIQSARAARDAAAKVEP